ncbi:DUF4329 domain-containing protein [Erythrobacter sp. SDW2]|uniref:DUF4329 domain-containing protein n=1 Tax=Erythrobacter sp. SDW2 TaxID=2907154 RepID=UPI001F2C4374|nr:DUF4329 domain-containing protein [Erythrobacter sp. SDW2]UIP05898.1 DUF4329 domain-containing protein [Erythrobacter sp. SDW2]
MRGAPSHTLVLALCALAWVGIVINSAIYARENPHSGRDPVASDSEIAAFARTALEDVQQRSFAERKEYCGLILEDDAGNLAVSAVFEGYEAECQLPWLSPMGQYPVATFHTHGAYNFDYDSEVPSTVDMEADIGEQIDGFVATPGGRLWKIDWEDEVAVQLCGEGCLATDPRYRPEPQGGIAQRYTLPELQQRQP